MERGGQKGRKQTRTEQNRAGVPTRYHLLDRSRSYCKEGGCPLLVPHEGETPGRINGLGRCELGST